MIRHKITAALFLLTTLSFCQTDSTKQINNWTIGTILMNEPKPFFNFEDGSFEPNFFNGIILKKHFKYFTIHIGLEYVNIIVKKDKPKCFDQLFSEGYINEGILSMGIDKGIIFKKYYRPFLTFDVVGIKLNSDITYTGGYFGIDERVIANTIGLGVITALGVEFKMTKTLSIGIETRLRLIYTKTTEDIHDIDNGAEDHKQYDEFIKKFNRIGAVTLNFNF